MELILASSSPRRSALLSEAGIVFRVEVPGVEEWDGDNHPHMPPVELARHNARIKGEAVFAINRQAYILAADTIVYCDGRVLGKPDGLEDARAMLAWLSGKTHEVLTAVVWINGASRVMKEFVARTWVTFRPLDAAGIEDYLAKVHVLDKAGSYALQDHGESIVERIEGSRSNVIGLPMEKVLEWWKEAHP
jgi:septum formation protein